MTVLVRHDHGCKWGRVGAEAEIDDKGHVTGYKPGTGHTDAAKRFSDTYNLHKAAGTQSGWIAVRYQDGSGGTDVFDSREEAIRHMWPREDWYFYCSLQEPAMSVCAAESVLRWKRIMSEVEKPDVEAKQGGLEVIPFLAKEDRAQQVTAALTGRGLLPMGYRKKG